MYNFLLDNKQFIWALILYMSWQQSCHDMYKIVAQMDN